MILLDGTKQIELLIFKDEDIPVDTNKEKFISLLKGTIFENVANDIHKWIFNIKCAPNPDKKNTTEDYLNFIKEQLNIANSLLAIKTEDKIKIGCSQAILPQQAKECLEQKLIELYKDNSLNIPSITIPHDEEREKWFESLTHQEHMDYLYKCVKEEKTIDDETIKELTKNNEQQEITKKQIKSTIKELEESLAFCKNKRGRTKSNSKLYCAIDVFLKHMRGVNLSNSIYRIMYECLSCMELIDHQQQLKLKNKSKYIYTYPIEEYMKAMCKETQEYEISYILWQPPI